MKKPGSVGGLRASLRLAEHARVMAAELGGTNDPKELVPGDVGAIVGTMYAMRSYGDTLREAGTGLSRVDTQEGWSGAAADQVDRGR